MSVINRFIDYEAHGGLTYKHLEELSYKDQVRFALFCANQVQKHWFDEPKFVKAIELTELWLEGKATVKECEAAASITNYKLNILYDRRDKGHDVDKSYLMSLIAADCAVYSVGKLGNTSMFNNSAKIASNAGYYASITDISLISAQIAYYNELRYIDENFERIVLENK